MNELLNKKLKLQYQLSDKELKKLYKKFKKFYGQNINANYIDYALENYLHELNFNKRKELK